MSVSFLYDFGEFRLLRDILYLISCCLFLCLAGDELLGRSGLKIARRQRLIQEKMPLTACPRRAPSRRRKCCRPP